LPPRAANHVWAYDFVFAACANGQQIKCLTVVDEFTHECLAIDVADSIRSGRVIDLLSRLMSVHGAPAVAPASAASAEEATTAARGDQPTAASAGHRDGSGMGLRFRLRRLRQWPAVEVPDGGR
jgi:hypothetical protein